MIRILCAILLAIGGKGELTEPLSNGSIKHPDVGLSTTQMIQRHGYPLQVHSNIATKEGYLLKIHRIHFTNTSSQNQPVAFLMHGLLTSSADWVNMGPEKSLAYQLADAGYDVWLGNARGTKWSRKHRALDATLDSKYWEFSWHEIGVSDLPTMIDYVLNTTAQEKLFYIGHSQGATAFFVMCSQAPRYNWKIHHMIALAPITYTSNVVNPFLKVIEEFYRNKQWISRFLGSHEFLPTPSLIQMLSEGDCRKQAIVETQCDSALFLLGGWNSIQLNKSMVPVITSNAPAGASTRQLLHYAQGISSGQFRQYDYGIMWNMMKYWGQTPPNYDINRIFAPITIFHADNDDLATIEDIKHFARQLPKMPNITRVNSESFNHLDFLYAMNAKALVYKHVLKLLEELKN